MDSVFPDKNIQTLNVVAVVMRNQNRIKILRALPDLFKGSNDGFGCTSHIYQNPGSLKLDKNGISAAAAVKRDHLYAITHLYSPNRMPAAKRFCPFTYTSDKN